MPVPRYLDSGFLLYVGMAAVLLGMLLLGPGESTQSAGCSSGSSLPRLSPA
jgi:hypothetical protein